MLIKPPTDDPVNPPGLELVLLSYLQSFSQLMGIGHQQVFVYAYKYMYIQKNSQNIVGHFVMYGDIILSDSHQFN